MNELARLHFTLFGIVRKKNRRIYITRIKTKRRKKIEKKKEEEILKERATTITFETG